MALSLITAPSTEPISLREAKLHLRVDTDDENDLIDMLISASRQFCETYTHRAFITQTWDLAMDTFPNGGVHIGDYSTLYLTPLWLPKPPLQSVTSVTYIDLNGVTQTWDPSLYSVDAPSGPWARPGRVTPGYGLFYPLARYLPNAATVRFVAGYGTDGMSVPAPIRAAMKLLIGNWWMNREAATIMRASADTLPLGVDQLLWPFKAF